MNKGPDRPRTMTFRHGEGNPSDSVLEYARRHPFAIAAVTDDSSISFRALNRLVGKAANSLGQTGFDPVATVGFRFKDQLLHMVFVLAAFRCGIAHVSLLHRWPDKLSNDLAEQTGAGVLFGDTAWPGADGRLETVSFASLNAAPDPADTSIRQNSGARPLLFVLGSGTTGAPRILHYNAEGLAAMIARDLKVRPIQFQERHYSMTAFDYFTGKRRSLGCLAAGGTVIFSNGPLSATAISDHHGVDHLSLVVSQAEAILDKYQGDAPRFPRLKSLVVGSSPVSEDLRRRIRERLSPNFFIGYGTNEFGEATFADADLQLLHPGSVGIPSPGVEIRIAGPDGQALPPGTTGEILLRAEGMFSGYLNDPDGTKAAFKDAWYRPGDLGALTPDGALLFQGRGDDLMIRYGTNIYPREIEQVLESVAEIKEAAAFPVASEAQGQIPVAAVTVHGAVQTPKQRGRFAKALRRLCNERLGPKAPTQIWIIEQMPRNEAGKIRKSELANIAEQEIGRDG
jgi:acyl-coenzyme A synthetase/AMP-(fatty) acid ligase